MVFRSRSLLSRAEFINCICSRRSVRKAKVPMPKTSRQIERTMTRVVRLLNIRVPPVKAVLLG
jgi:hypothetical protein